MLTKNQLDKINNITVRGAKPTFFILIAVFMFIALLILSCENSGDNTGPGDTTSGTDFTKWLNTATTTAGKAAYTPSGTDIAVSSASDLDAMRNNLSRVYYLTKNITLSGMWTPIGTNTNPFTGTLHGRGFIIYGLAVSETSTTADGAGLFGVIDGATIDHLAIQRELLRE